MSEVRTCEVCGHQEYASAALAPRRITIEYEADDGTLHSHDWTLCYDCHRELDGGWCCPYCLEPVMQDEDPADCPKNPENEEVAA